MPLADSASLLSNTLPSQGLLWEVVWLELLLPADEAQKSPLSTFGTFVSSFRVVLVTVSTGPVYPFLSRIGSAVFTLRSTCEWVHCQLAFLHTIQASSMNASVCVCVCVSYADRTHLLSSTSSLALIDTFTLGKVV